MFRHHDAFRTEVIQQGQTLLFELRHADLDHSLSIVKTIDRLNFMTNGLHYWIAMVACSENASGVCTAKPMLPVPLSAEGTVKLIW